MARSSTTRQRPAIQLGAGLGRCLCGVRWWETMARGHREAQSAPPSVGACQGVAGAKDPLGIAGTTVFGMGLSSFGLCSSLCNPARTQSGSGSSQPADPSEARYVKDLEAFSGEDVSD